MKIILRAMKTKLRRCFYTCFHGNKSLINFQIFHARNHGGRFKQFIRVRSSSQQRTFNSVSADRKEMERVFMETEKPVEVKNCLVLQKENFTMN